MAERICTPPRLIPERTVAVWVMVRVRRYVPAVDMEKGRLKAVGAAPVTVAPKLYRLRRTTPPKATVRVWVVAYETSWGQA